MNKSLWILLVSIILTVYLIDLLFEKKRKNKATTFLEETLWICTAMISVFCLIDLVFK